MQAADLALQRNKYKHLSYDEWRWFLQQVEGRERTADKLPAFAAIDEWWYPVRLSCEQCSSELTAKYKASLLSSFIFHPSSLLDLTGGYGVDTYFLSEHFEHTDYVEQNAELCRIAEHNFSLPTPSHPNGKGICIHHSTAEEFLSNDKRQTTNDLFDLIYLDPYRRDSHGGKVFRLEDCMPNVVELLPVLLQHLTPDGRLMLKLSPMLDLTQALKTLAVSHSPLAFDVHVVAVRNEVKEVLLLSRPQSALSHQTTITAVDLSKKDQAFVFTREEEASLTVQRSYSETVLQQSGLTGVVGLYIYEPNAAILKAGAYKLVAQRFGLAKLDVNTHLYASDTLLNNFPGRVWRINSQFTIHNSQIEHANVLTRNYPLTPEQLKKKYRLKDGGDLYLIGCRVNGKPMLFVANRI